MHSPRLISACLGGCLLLIPFARAAEPPSPSVRDPRLALRLFAAEPDVVTPIGIAVDARRRVFVLESHTHFPKADYPGPKADRIKVLEDRDGDGRADHIAVFHEGLHHGMNLAFGPDGHLHATHRNGLVRLEDRDGDGVAERRVDLLVMETAGNYPHNGIGGLAFSPDGWIYVGLGENLGEKFTLRGTDGRTESDREGGFVFRCRPDGSQLERVAAGFWNPFGLAFHGREFLLAVDNDPDSRPPNRLLDVIPGGDYGFKFRFGRQGLHPFQAWNGELPGTLPMAGPVGEGSSAVLSCATTTLPSSCREAVLVTAGWDHRIELCRLQPLGASLSAERETLVEGGDQFRPIGLATAPNGEVFVTDWVDASYNVHGLGRIWRLGPAAGPARPGKELVLKPTQNRRRLHALLAAQPGQDRQRVLAALADPDPFLVSAAVTTLARPAWRDTAWQALTNANPAVRLGGLLALRRAAVTNAPDAAGPRLHDPDPQVRRLAVVWTGEEALLPLTNQLAAALTAGAVTPDLLRAHAATAQILAKAAGGKPVTPTERAAFAFLETADPTRALALLRAPAREHPLSVRLAAVDTLTGTTHPPALDILRSLAGDRRQPAALRAEAAAALAGTGATSTATLLRLLADADPELRLAAARALRGAVAEPDVQAAFTRRLGDIQTAKEDVLREELAYALELAGAPAGRTSRPQTPEQWRAVLQAGGSVERGQRVFFSPQTGCGRCHRVEDRGGRLGPDLSTIARGADREKLIRSILEPSRDIPPQFVAHTVETRDGEAHTGLLLAQGADSGITLATMEGKAVVLPAAEITAHTQSKVSLMPEGLERTLTVGEFRDLLAFLLSRR